MTVSTWVCSLCGATLWADTGMCVYHVPVDAEWAAENHRMCDFVHRGIPLPWPKDVVVPTEPEVVMAWYES